MVVHQSKPLESANTPAPQWTLKFVNIEGTLSIVSHITSQGIHPIAAVQAVLMDPTLTVDEDYTLVPKTHLVWETTLAPAHVCAPVFIFNILLSGNVRSNLCYVMSLKEKEAPTVPQSAIGIVKEWFRDLTYNPAVVDSAMRFGVSQVQLIVAAGAFHLLRVCTSYVQRVEVMDAVLRGPWKVCMATPFFRMMHECMRMAPIPCEIVMLTPRCEPDVIVESYVGFVFAQNEDVADRVALLFLLIFSSRYNLLARWKEEGKEKLGIPTQIETFLDVIVRKSHPPFYCIQDHTSIHNLDHGGSE